MAKIKLSTGESLEVIELYEDIVTYYDASIERLSLTRKVNLVNKDLTFSGETEFRKISVIKSHIVTITE